jgi:hypothetical protein
MELREKAVERLKGKEERGDREWKVILSAVTGGSVLLEG